MAHIKTLMALMVLNLNFKVSIEMQRTYCDIKHNLKTVASTSRIEKEEIRPDENDEYNDMKSYSSQRKHPGTISLSKQKRETIKRKLDFVNCPNGARCDYNEQMDVPACYCDKTCVEFKDCCYGFNENKMPNKVSNITLYKDYLKCRFGIIPGPSSNFKGYWMVTKCPEAYPNLNISTKCTSDNEYDVPVTDEQGIAYWNTYCAVCHNVTRLKPWSVKIDISPRYCRSKFTSDILLKSHILTTTGVQRLRRNACTFTYLPPKITKYPRTCFKSVQVSESKNNSEPCQKNLNPVLVNYRLIYRSEFCTDNWKKIHCIEDGFPYNSKSPLDPLSILFVMKEPQVDQNALCSPGQEFDSETKMCFPKYCGTNETNSKTCHTGVDDITIKNYKIHVNMTLVSDSVIEQHLFIQIASMLKACLPVAQYDLFETFPSWKDSNRLYTIPTKQHSPIKSVLNMTYNYMVRKVVNMHMLSNLKSRIQDMEWEYTLLYKESRIHLWRVWSLNITISEWDVTIISWDDIVIGFSFFDFLVNKDTLPVISDIPGKCNVDVVGIETNQTVNSSLKYVAKIDFEMETVKTQIPFSADTSPGIHADENQMASGVLTYITLSISCGAVAPTILLHRYLNLVSTIPGKITEQILVLLLLFSISFMSGSWFKGIYVICLCIAVITHFLILSFFTWISIFVCHTLKQLKDLKHSSPDFNNAPLPKLYILTGYLIPFFIVLPSVIIEVCGCTYIEIGYTRTVCFPTGYPANLIVVVVPILLFLVIHIISLTYSAWCLYRITKDSSHTSVNTSRSYISIYIRLCLISGLSWGVGVLSETLDNNILRYVFILISGSHGLIFVLCIVSTKTFQESFRNKMFTSTPPEQIELDAYSFGEQNSARPNDSVEL